MLELNYERRGSGSPLVLLHGIGHRWQAWRPVLDRLAERHDVIALDLPGFGRSPALPAGYRHDLPGSVQLLGQVFAQLGLDRPHVAGNSLGGVIAIEAASHGMVASATALSPAGFWNSRDRRMALSTLQLIRAGALFSPPGGSPLVNNARLRVATLGLLYAHPERIDRISALGDMQALRASRSFAATIRAGHGFAWDGVAPSVPVTVAWGDKDRVLPPRQAQRAARLLPAAHHLTLPDCGHVPMSDNPELVARTILDTAERAAREASVHPDHTHPDHTHPDHTHPDHARTDS